MYFIHIRQVKTFFLIIYAMSICVYVRAREYVCYNKYLAITLRQVLNFQALYEFYISSRFQQHIFLNHIYHNKEKRYNKRKRFSK